MPSIRTRSAVAASALVAVLIASSGWAQAGGGAGGTGQSSPDRTYPNRAATGQGATASQARSGQEPFDFGGQLRARDNGLVVGTVREDGFFHNAGILEGDRIISVNGREVTSEADFRRLMMAEQGRFPVIVMRNGQRHEIVVAGDDLKASNDLNASSDESSIPVYERMNDSRAALGIWFHSLPEGAHIVRVVPGSPAERAGLQPGDFITRINGKPCNDWQATTCEIAEANPQSILKLEVSRHGLTMPLEAELGGHYEVFSDPDENWNNLAAQDQGDANRLDDTRYNDARYNDARYGGTRFNGAGRYWTGRANPTGPDSEQGARMQPGDTQNLERRIRQLEREVSDLREQLNRVTSTGAPAGNQNNGQRTSAPPDGQ